MKPAIVTEQDRRAAWNAMYPVTPPKAERWIAGDVDAAGYAPGDILKAPGILRADQVAQCLANARREGELRGEKKALQFTADHDPLALCWIAPRIAELEKELSEQ